MAYRNGTYVAFDGQGTTDPTQSENSHSHIAMTSGGASPSVKNGFDLESH
ncbi:MAG: hypothetical protein IJ555_04185 [Ruminococcus sp.]|nr:hypothetical protein [Ruminococcus sp.]